MEWLVEKGQDLSTENDSHAKTNFTQNFWPGDRRTASLELLAFDADKAPHISTEQVHRYYKSQKGFTDLVC